MKKQHQNITNIADSQKPATKFDPKTQELFNCFNHPNKLCTDIVIGKKGETPDPYTLEAYCLKCRKPLEKTINELIPIKVRGANLNKCKQIIQDYFFEEFAKNKGLYLWGKPGRGKTWVMYAIIKRIIFIKGEYWASYVRHQSSSVNQNVKITSMSRIYQDLTDGQFNKNFSSSEYKDELYKFGLLIIDDIGMEKMSDFRQEILEDIIDTRYKNEKITLFTSNYSLEQLIDRVGGEIAGSRIVSRIIEICEIIELKGENRRLKK